MSKRISPTDDFIRIYRDMVIIREFENMINEIKIKNEYRGIAYNHPGPAHLSMGQEASAVGMAYTLTVDDLIFGSHRSHGEILAKGLSAIHQLSEACTDAGYEDLFQRQSTCRCGKEITKAL